MAEEETTVESVEPNTRALHSLVSWYYTTYLSQQRGLDNNALWLVTIWPQEGDKSTFLKMVATEASRYDKDAKGVRVDGVPTGYSATNMGRMVFKSWDENVRSTGNTNIENWGAANVLMPVVDISLPVDSIRTKTVDLGPGYTWVPPLLADKHEAFKPFTINMYYTTYPFSEFVLRPWSMAINRWGLKLASLRCNMVLTLFTRTNQYKNEKGRNWLHKYDYRYYGCYPLGVPNIKFDYKDSAQDKTVAVNFGYDFFRIDVVNDYVSAPLPEIADGKLDLDFITITDEYNDEPNLRTALWELDNNPLKPNNDDVPNPNSGDYNDVIKEVAAEDTPKPEKSKEVEVPVPDEPDEINSEVKPMLWLDTPLFPITLILPTDMEDEPMAITSLDKRPGADEFGGKLNTNRGRIGGDEFDGRLDVNRPIGLDDEIDGIGENIVVVDKEDEYDGAIDSDMATDENDEPDRLGSQIITIGEDEPDDVNSEMGNVGMDEPNGPLNVSKEFIENDEGIVKPTPPLNLGIDEPDKFNVPILKIEDDEKMSRAPSSRKITTDEPRTIGSRNLNVRSDEPKTVGNREITPKEKDEVDSIKSKNRLPSTSDEIEKFQKSKDIEPSEDEPKSVPIIVIEQ